MKLTSVSNTFNVNACSVGHYVVTPAQNVTTPNRQPAAAYSTGCLMTSNLNNEMTFGPWFNTGAAQVLRVGVTTAAPGVTPVAANFDPPDANIPAIYQCIDNVELPITNGAVVILRPHVLRWRRQAERPTAAKHVPQERSHPNYGWCRHL